MVGHVRASGKITAMFVLGVSGVSALGCAGGRSADPARAPAPPAAQGAGVGAAPAAEPSGEDLVAFSLIADRAMMQPGQPITLAARFDIDPEWHIYWQNPGESGLATEVTFEAPEGYEVGPVRYPGPVAFSSPGPVVSYGYAGTVLLSAVVQVPHAAWEQGPATFTADAFWLACRDTCVRGQGKATLTVPVPRGTTGLQALGGPGSEVERVLSEHTARLPRPWPAEAGARHAWEKSPDGPLLVLRLPARLASGASPVFFPSTDDQLVVTGQEQVNDGTDVVVRVNYRAIPASGYARGVLGVDDIFYQLDVSGPAAGN